MIISNLFKNIAVCIYLIAAVTPISFADTKYPKQPIKMVVPFSPGGSVDLSARLMQSALSKILNQTIVIDNRTGAGGTIGSNEVAKSKPDGYTLLFTASSHSINPSLYKLLFDTATDFLPVSKIASAPQVLVANKNFAHKSLSELMNLSHEESKSINYASGGIGTPGHMAGELFKARSGAQFPHIPYRGGAPAALDVIGGQVPLLWVSLPAVSAYIQSGELIALAVSTKERSRFFPEIPSVSEFIPDFDVDIWYAIFAPADTPKHVLNVLSDAIAKVNEQPNIQNAFNAQGFTYLGSSRVELADTMTRELQLWADLIQRSGIKAEN